MVVSEYLYSLAVDCDLRYFVLGVVATSGVIHISLGHISPQVRILGISCHLFIYTFHFI